MDVTSHTPGSFCTSVLRTRDIDRAAAFYSALGGWTFREVTPTAPFPSYTVFKRGEVSEGGILPIHPDWESTPCWNSIFAVDDCDAMIARAESLGGCEIFVHTVPKAGRIGSLSDSGGAAFVIRGPTP